MKKTILIYSLIFAFITGVFYACQKENIVTPFSANTQSNAGTLTGQSQSSNKGPLKIIDPTLSYFQDLAGRNKYKLTKAPNGYVPSKKGIWHYSEVYLFNMGAAEKIWELYEFSDPTQLAMAARGTKGTCEESKGTGSKVICNCDNHDLNNCDCKGFAIAVPLRPETPRR